MSFTRSNVTLHVTVFVILLSLIIHPLEHDNLLTLQNLGSLNTPQYVQDIAKLMAELKTQLKLLKGSWLRQKRRTWTHFLAC